jgi:formylglycine-generating enzyme required for sulfatase activity
MTKIHMKPGFPQFFIRALVLGAAVRGLVCAQEFQITKLDPAGELTFQGIARAMAYQMEWSSAPGKGEWYREGLGFVEMPVGGAGERMVRFQPRPAPCFYRVVATLGPEGFAFIPAGTFRMGDSFSEGHPVERPVHSVTVRSFYLQARETTKEEWDEVHAWGLASGYAFGGQGAAKAANHPTYDVTWYDVVKWCNARSEKEGRLPCYYVDASFAAVYRSGEVDITNDRVLWTANGYRLPTEAEWEMAARGGLEGKRYPWGDVITHLQANYWSSTTYSYDTSPTRGYHPLYASGSKPYTSPVGSFTPNSYGLYDMTGNVWEWCWDWFGNYSSAAVNDPRGVFSGSSRILRGGAWEVFSAREARVTYRAGSVPSYRSNIVGFRQARGR